MKILTHTAAALLGAVAVTAAGGYAAGTWHTLATGSDSGKHGAFVNVDASIGNPQELGVTTSRPANVSWSVTCNGLVSRTRPGQVVSMSVGTAAKCTANAVATTAASGTLRVQIVRR